MDESWHLRTAYLGLETAKPSYSRARLRRIARSERYLDRAYAPMRLLLKVVMTPVMAVAVATSIFISAGPYEREAALGHIVAIAGCEAADAVGLAPSRKGQPGYHRPLDPDGDGRSCQSDDIATAAGVLPAGGAKFLRAN
ncbi:MAG: excalibur calcium-binding domain-containing protein [Paracoccaceae bacterium]